MNLRDPSAFSPPLPEYRARGARSKDVGKDEDLARGCNVDAPFGVLEVDCYLVQLF